MVLLSLIMAVGESAADSEVRVFGYPYDASASSALRSSGSSYSSNNVLPPSIRTAWCEGVEGDGIGQYLQLRLEEPISVSVLSISVLPGYVKTNSLFSANGRPKRMTVRFNGASEGEVINLKDMPLEQSFSFKTEGLRDVRVIELMIDDVYSGGKYRDTCITEVIIQDPIWFESATDEDIQAEVSLLLDALKGASSGNLDDINTLVALVGGAYYKTSEGGSWLDEIYLDLFVLHTSELMFVLLKKTEEAQKAVFKAIENPVSDKYSNGQIKEALRRASANGLDREVVKFLQGSFE